MDAGELQQSAANPAAWVKPLRLPQGFKPAIKSLDWHRKVVFRSVADHEKSDSGRPLKGRPLCFCLSASAEPRACGIRFEDRRQAG